MARNWARACGRSSRPRTATMTPSRAAGTWRPPVRCRWVIAVPSGLRLVSSSRDVPKMLLICSTVPASRILRLAASDSTTSRPRLVKVPTARSRSAADAPYREASSSRESTADGTSGISSWRLRMTVASIRWEGSTGPRMSRRPGAGALSDPGSGTLCVSPGRRSSGVSCIDIGAS
ncbi:hypothetical protein AHiyo1_34880 [Arthrobacter sp. Hiyo1]|nr:hypothetical protein AHiyo1_34880 [Arthrobacter sp. Hiyo1]